jgi:hypothetical protein
LQLVVPVGQLHDPLTHDAPPEHAMPHAPQFLESTLTSTQLPLQSVSAAPHPLPQAPPLHTWLVVHAAPQAPQFDRSELLLTQTPLQIAIPTGHVHVPLTHAAPAAHALPQEPQFLASLLVETQAPLQFV